MANMVARCVCGSQDHDAAHASGNVCGSRGGELATYTVCQLRKVVMPDASGRCGACGVASFHGPGRAADGTRGYICTGCGSVKPENWREIRSGAVAP